MTTKKEYEILNSLPTYGMMYIPVSDNEEPFYSEGVVIRFQKTDGTEWIANFQSGSTDLKEIIELKNTKSLLVIANGTCYLINPNEIKPIDVFGFGYSKVFKTSNDRLILQDDTSLTIIEPDGNHWMTERISWDGLTKIKVDNNLVTGLSYNPIHNTDEWIEFKYDIDSKKLTGGSYFPFEKKKPWWKIW